MSCVGVVGDGVVGERIVRRLPLAIPGVDIVTVEPRRWTPAEFSRCDVVVLAMAAPHAPVTAGLLAAGIPTVTVADRLDDVRALTDLDDVARHAGVPLVVGAGMSPGLTGLLARHLAGQMASVDEIHVAVHGTAGPSCARGQHRALAGLAVGWHDGDWIRRPAGSGRELCFFPEPVGGYDTYRAELASPILLHASFPEAGRISARVSANRRDRFTSWLPMLSPPHREGGVGAVRVEVRGSEADGSRTTRMLGIAELVGTATAATAVAFAAATIAGLLPPGVVRSGDGDLDTLGLLRTVGELGVRLQEFTGVPSVRRVAA